MLQYVLFEMAETSGEKIRLNGYCFKVRMVAAEKLLFLSVREIALSTGDNPVRMILNFDDDLMESIGLTAVWIIANDVAGAEVFLDRVVNRFGIVGVRHIRNRAAGYIGNLF